MLYFFSQNIHRHLTNIVSTLSDLSKNRLADIPREVCDFRSLERLDVYHNVIRALPHALVQLQALVHLNLRYVASPYRDAQPGPIH